MTHVHIYAPKATAKRLVCGKCPDCKKQTRFLEFFTPWHGWQSTCMRCGREWQDGAWISFPFYRYARKNSKDAAKAYWRKMPPMSKNHWGLETT